jgi:EAL domain-containing protein (putative c-di-GMP-specific phosphodiesterase class I)
LEVSEVGCFSNLDAFRSFHLDAHQYGCKVGLEHFGRQFDKINYLHDLQIDYVKIDGGFIRNIDINEGNQAFVKGIANVVRRMGMQVYTEGVNTEEEIAALTQLGLDGITGPAVGKKFSKLN